MAQKSSIDRLPPDIREQLHALLADPRCTQLDITARINELLDESGEELRLSKSAVNRYAMKMEQVGAKLKQSRQIAEVWIGRLGAAPQGQVGQLLNEVVRNLAFDTALHMAEDEDPAHPKLIRDLAVAIERLERAASENEKRAEDIRRKAREEAAERAATVARADGVSAETIQKIRRDVLMMGP